MITYPFNVLHQAYWILEHRMIDALEDVADCGSGLIEVHLVGVIDMAAAVWLCRTEVARDEKLRRDVIEIVHEGSGSVGGGLAKQGEHREAANDRNAGERTSQYHVSIDEATDTEEAGVDHDGADEDAEQLERHSRRRPR